MLPNAAPKPKRLYVPDYRAYLRELPCLLAGETPCECGPYLDVARKRIATRFCHVRSRGAGGSDPANGWPGCDFHHGEQHRLGIKTFEHRHRAALGGRTLKHIARELWRDWPERAAWEALQLAAVTDEPDGVG